MCLFNVHLFVIFYTIDSLPNSAIANCIFQKHIDFLNQANFSPVQVCQLLYSKRCLSEATLNEIESECQKKSLNEKKAILLTAMQQAVSSDYRKLKDISLVLTGVDNIKDIANGMLTEYGK